MRRSAPTAHRIPQVRARWALGASALVIGIVELAAVPAAHAQINPGGVGPGLGGPRPGEDKDKKEGVAEAAPKTPGLLPTTPALPAPRGRRKRWKLFELDGYFRLRTDWFRNFNLGFPDRPDRPDLGGSPFPTALGCKSAEPDAPCDESLSSGNLRLRLEPTINLDEGTSIHVQADLLDNLVLGSTPTDPVAGPPLGAFGNGTQSPQVRGVNSDRDAVQIKRAWAEVALPLGVAKFGRMPNHWGMGILHNAGGNDPINGVYDYDADLGDTVDRASFSLLIPGTNLRAMIASDWSLSRLVSNQTSAGKGRESHPFDLDDSDDINSWIGVISRIDSPQEFKDTLDRGELAFNYGVYFEYKTQEWDYDLTGFQLGGPTDPNNNQMVNHYVPRHLKTYAPDVWAKVGFGPFMVEAEFVAQIGSVDVADAAGARTELDIRKYGGAARLTWRGLEDRLRLGVEGGFASGDQWDNTPQGATHISNGNPLGGPGDDTLNQFMFNREYKIDMILWRHLIGAVTNAGYVKPFLQYDITKSIGFKIANITSFALRKVATPGNESMYGTEFNGDVSYSSNGLTVGASYGVLFPLAALHHPADVGDTKYGYTGADGDISNVGEAETAHYIQLRAVLAF